ncbi:syntaxin-1A-like isoform X5 [Leptotrombidium deliense]|uniref:Syntaxin-1A-like isoform X5 n=1 Tax=Leptotrombidium deliense TaxID=299467 RepID=A0A443SKT4_9ACAR|nr:syntaxin-1A-like isoform X5 [Leptotrombidium deliense]
MTKDRIKDLHSLRRRQDQSDIEMNAGDVGLHTSVQFLSEVEEVRDEIEKLNENITAIRVKQKSVGTPKDEGSRKLEEIIDKVKYEALKIKERLKNIDGQTEAIANSNPNSTECRIRRTQQSMLWQMFREAMDNYNKAQLEYKEKCRNIIKLQLEVMGKQTTDEDLDNMLEKENTAVFTQELISDTQEARLTLSSIEDRHRDIITIEKSIRELRDLFLEMALTVEQQGESLNRIETHVSSAVTAVEKGEKQLEGAKATQKRTRKMKIWCYLLIIIIVVVLILSLVFSLK